MVGKFACFAICGILLDAILLIVYDTIKTIHNFRVYKRIVGKNFFSYFVQYNVIKFYVTDSNLEKLKKRSKEYNVGISQVINDALNAYEG